MNLRNKPCKCGSNKKFKKCCFNPNDVEELNIRQRAEYLLAKQKRDKEFEEAKDRAVKLLAESPRQEINALFAISAMLSMDLRYYNFHNL